jgi:hypothetical protein
VIRTPRAITADCHWQSTFCVALMGILISFRKAHTDVRRVWLFMCGLTSRAVIVNYAGSHGGVNLNSRLLPLDTVQ